jgi:hypothetical protein
MIGSSTQQRQISPVQQQLGTGFIDKHTIATDVVEMTVRIDHHLQGEPVLVEDCENSFRVTAGIDNNGLMGPGASQYVTIDPEFTGNEALLPDIDHFSPLSSDVKRSRFLPRN